jgi:hypothetical protein
MQFGKRFGKRSVAAAVAATVVAAGFAVIGTSSAASAAGLCGDGFYRVETKDIKAKSGTKLGELRLYWNGSTQQNCVVTMRTGKAYGENNFTSAFLSAKASGQSAKDEAGYSHYAGPVKVEAPSCIKAYGFVFAGSQRGYAEINGHC